jgi:hypothetical protein
LDLEMLQCAEHPLEILPHKLLVLRKPVKACARILLNCEAIRTILELLSFSFPRSLGFGYYHVLVCLGRCQVKLGVSFLQLHSSAANALGSRFRHSLATLYKFATSSFLYVI